jgi:hypothetical protein
VGVPQKTAVLKFQGHSEKVKHTVGQFLALRKHGEKATAHVRNFLFCWPNLQQQQKTEKHFW